MPTYGEEPDHAGNFGPKHSTCRTNIPSNGQLQTSRLLGADVGICLENERGRKQGVECSCTRTLPSTILPTTPRLLRNATPRQAKLRLLPLADSRRVVRIATGEPAAIAVGVLETRAAVLAFAVDEDLARVFVVAETARRLEGLEFGPGAFRNRSENSGQGGTGPARTCMTVVRQLPRHQ